ncbi:serine hydrolase domain-containing protein [Spirosoma fluviale]|uniref:CubicO group peptidase, beta-lactamase class C family n=1 Tax=Spirosoma fluviale TaxID=1597977 RepID=A0A286FAX9_9BACT|nr:serine hydrolase domain-containing protein [Spirosoma fluviale]SOD80353.1 CubicO group peptidase, beta-lactamase class C family [Spirosoma fluviale]
MTCLLHSLHCLWLVVIWLITLSASAQRVPADESNREIDQFVRRLMDSAHVPGLSIAIIRNGALHYRQGYGLTKSDSTQRVTSETIFDAASLSKPVFAYAVLQLVEQELLDLDKPLFEYLPYPDVASDDRYKKITARLVLSHRTGFPNWRKNRRSPKLAMVAPPGERFGYSGEGYVYLQKVVEKITGKPLNTLMTELVFKPLQMTRSSYIWNPAFDANFSLPHNQDGEPEPKYKSSLANAAYSLQTTADDYARFILAILTSKGVKISTIDQMLTSQGQLPTRFSGGETLSPTLSWGLGVGLERTPAADYFWHWGDNDTYKCYMVANRKRREAVVYFTNSTNGLSLIDTMTRQFMGFSTSTVGFLGYK